MKLPKLSGLALFLFILINVASAQTALATIPVSGTAQAVAFNPATNKIYAVGGIGNYLTEIDGTTFNYVTIPLQSTSDIASAQVAANAVTNKVYVINVVNNNVAVIDGSTHDVSFLPTGQNPYRIAINPLTNRIYIANFTDNTVTVVNGSDGSTSTIQVGLRPSAIAVNQVTNRIYVANIDSTASVINGDDNQVTTVPVGSYSSSIAVDSNHNKIYVANILSGDLTVIDGKTNSTQSIPVGDNPFFVAVNPLTSNVYAAFQIPGNMAVVNKNYKVKLIPAGQFQNEILVDEVHDKIYVADSAGNQVVVIDGRTRKSSTIPGAGNFAWRLALNPLTNQLCVANLMSQDVTIFDVTPPPSDDGLAALQVHKHKMK